MVEGDNKERNDVEGLSEPIEVHGAEMGRLCSHCATKPCSWTNPNYPKCFVQAEVPHMRDEVEVRRLTQKQEAGAVNVVKKVLDQPEVQNLLKKSISKQTFISGLFMSLLLIGFFQLVTVAKTVLNYNWLGDLVMGLVMVVIGAVYMFKQLRGK